MKNYFHKCMFGLLVLVTVNLGALPVARAQSSALSCQELWVERNSYYKDAGYCFKTQRAISYFGNGGCQYDNEASLRLPRRIQGRIAEIVSLERRNGCN
jgi:hypothetical protein